MSGERPIPLEQNDRARMLLDRLQQGPVSTVELQRSLPLVHVARQVWELRHWYGYSIKTSRLPNRVAVYAIAGRVAAPEIAKRPVCPRCGEGLRDLRQTLVGNIVNGRCPKHGRTDVRLPDAHSQ